VREHEHSHSDYIAAFDNAQLSIRTCIEPRLTADEVFAKRRAVTHIEDAAMAAYVGLPAVLVWSLAKAPSPPQA
jgi:hypothetical protein